ncbi:hypothetical protein NLJ89_g9798 [Agrocybe chaxingu]|uniref:Uncharacterized protein n=1 Tax=Agrocybe chaxingu TaxID=84603 RepID=A0A9W8JQ35_9AGAR|nr:hypothetical protein NLJ89_g9798 [Agrocybe chaxingu]
MRTTVDIVTVLFHGHPKLLAGFNRFLPAEYRIPVPEMLSSHGPISAAAGGTETILDPLCYILAVKEEFKDQPEVYSHFIDIMIQYLCKRATYRTRFLRVRGHPALLQGFNCLLPAPYWIEVEADDQLGPLPRQAPTFDMTKSNFDNIIQYLIKVKVRYGPQKYYQFLDIIRQCGETKRLGDPEIIRQVEILFWDTHYLLAEFRDIASEEGFALNMQ